MSFPKYPRYIESEVSWLEAIPEHWRVQRLKYVCSMFSSNVDKKSVEGQPAVKLCNYTDVYYNEEITEQLDFMPATATQEQIEKFTLKEGDTLITKDSESPDDIAVPAFVPRTLPGVICGYHLAVIRPKSAMNGWFVSRLFQSSYVKAKCHVGANGLTRYGLSQSALNDLDLPVPPLLEQLQIASFLDQETSKIDALITEQQRLIELLKEKRQAVISHAVTKGLNPDVRMKPSGVEWLGQVPEHWSLIPLKHCVKLLTDKAAESSFPVALENVQSWTGNFVPCEGEFSGEGVAFEAGDILFGKLRPYLAKAFLAERAGEAVGDFHVLRPKAGVFSRWLQYRILSREFIAEINSASFGSKMPRVSWEFMGSMPIPVPPKQEQQAVVDKLDRELVVIDELVLDADKSIALLQERRTTLISAVVTGKIDVRNYASTQKDAA